MILPKTRNTGDDTITIADVCAQPLSAVHTTFHQEDAEYLSCLTQTHPSLGRQSHCTADIIPKEPNQEHPLCRERSSSIGNTFMVNTDRVADDPLSPSIRSRLTHYDQQQRHRFYTVGRLLSSHFPIAYYGFQRVDRLLASYEAQHIAHVLQTPPTYPLRLEIENCVAPYGSETPLASHDDRIPACTAETHHDLYTPDLRYAQVMYASSLPLDNDHTRALLPYFDIKVALNLHAYEALVVTMIFPETVVPHQQFSAWSSPGISSTLHEGEGDAEEAYGSTDDAGEGGTYTVLSLTYPPPYVAWMPSPTTLHLQNLLFALTPLYQALYSGDDQLLRLTCLAYTSGAAEDVQDLGLQMTPSLMTWARLLHLPLHLSQGRGV